MEKTKPQLMDTNNLNKGCYRSHWKSNLKIRDVQSINTGVYFFLIIVINCYGSSSLRHT